MNRRNLQALEPYSLRLSGLEFRVQGVASLAAQQPQAAVGLPTVRLRTTQKKIILPLFRSIWGIMFLC